MNLEDKRCCGFDTGTDRPTLLGLLTVAFPLWLFASVAAALLSLLRLRQAAMPGRAAGAALRVMNIGLDGPTRMAVSQKIYGKMPTLSGLTYKYFNPLLLGLLWLAVAAAVYAIIWILKK